MQQGMATILVALVLCILPTTARMVAHDDHPIAGVITLLKELSEKVKKEGRDEAETYQTFEKWCKDSISTLNGAIEDEKAKIESLEDEVSSKTALKESLTKEIAETEEEIGRVEAQAGVSEKDRKEANELYLQADQDLADTVDAIDQAIKALSETKDAVDSLIQQRRSLTKLIRLPLVLEQLTTDQREELMGSASLRDEPEEEPEVIGDPGMPIYKSHTRTYEFKSGNVVSLLKELKKKFEADRVENTNAETQAANEYEIAKGAGDAALETAKASKKTKETSLSDTKSDLETAKADLKSEQDELKADSESLKDTTTNCEVKATEWDERQQIREHEVEAMIAAIRILKEVSGVRSDKPENEEIPEMPTEPSTKEEDASKEESPAKEASFLHLSLLQILDPKQRAVNLLRQRAREVKSKVLEHFANQIAAKLGGPFDEVNQMIQKMIFRLMAEQKDEDDHKAWCDVELSKTNQSKADKEERIKGYTAKIDADKATVAALQEDIKAAEAMVDTLAKHIQEASDIRQTNKKENEEAIKDAEDAQAALARATAVIQDFYKDSGAVPKEAWELVQTHVQGRQQGVDLPEEPATWDASYTGVTDPQEQPGGVLTVLKEVAADFAKMEAETRAQEETDRKAFEEQMQTAKIDKARRAKEAEMKDQESKRLGDKIDAMEKQRHLTENELGAVEQYIKDLQPACVEGDSTYEDRKEARAKEITALKEAQVILADAMEGSAPAPAAFLQSKPIQRVQ